MREVFWHDRNELLRHTKRSAMFPPFQAALVAAPFVIGVADPVPKFNLNAICAGEGMRGPDVCIKTETAAHDDLAKQWAQFPAADRARCVQLATMSKMPSYVQVLTCLEMARDARQINAPGRSGSTSSSSQPRPPGENSKQ
jgi:hypothetical protein